MTQRTWAGLKPLGAFRTRGPFVTRPRLPHSAAAPAAALQYGQACGEQGNAERSQSQIAHPCSYWHPDCLSMTATSAGLTLQPRQSPEPNIQTKPRSQFGWRNPLRAQPSPQILLLLPVAIWPLPPLRRAQKWSNPSWLLLEPGSEGFLDSTAHAQEGQLIP